MIKANRFLKRNVLSSNHFSFLEYYRTVPKGMSIFYDLAMFLLTISSLVA